MAFRGLTLSREASLSTLDKSEPHRCVFSTPSSIVSTFYNGGSPPPAAGTGPADDVSIRSYQLPESRAQDFADFPPDSFNLPLGPQPARTQSPVLVLLTSFARIATFVSNKMLFTQRCLILFRNNFETDERFNKVGADGSTHFPPLS